MSSGEISANDFTVASIVLSSTSTRRCGSSLLSSAFLFFILIFYDHLFLFGLLFFIFFLWLLFWRFLYLLFSRFDYFLLRNFCF